MATFWLSIALSLLGFAAIMFAIPPMMLSCWVNSLNLTPDT
jgi:hypothetical protein